MPPKKKTIAQDVKRIEKKVAKLVSEVELKVYDLVISAGINSGGTISNLINILQGTSVSTRIGDQIRVMKIEVKDYWYMSNSSTPDFTNFVRTLIIEDPSCGSVLPAVGTVLSAFNAPVTVGFLKRYKIHYDRTHCLSAQGPACAHQDHVITFKSGKLIQFNQNNGTVLDCVARSFYLLQISDSTVNPSPLSAAYIRIYFQDS